MEQKLKVIIFAAAAHMLLSMMATIIQSRKRKRGEMREPITYGPMEERDRIRIDYLNTRIWRDDTTCMNMLRLNRARFFRFCMVFRNRGLLQDTVHMCVEQQVAMFLNTVGHNLRNRLVGTNYDRSGETVSRYFNKVLHAIGELRAELIRPPSLETPTKIAGSPRWDPYFKDCIGAIDGTHVRASVPKDMEHAFRGRKSYCTQNVMVAVDFDLWFTYVLAGWEGTAHDALVLRDALERENGLRVSGWDEDNCIITLDADHYNDYVKDHKSDADYFNKPLENYVHMATIFGNSMATGKFAKDSSCTLGTEETEQENDGDGDGNVDTSTPEDNGASSSATRPNKKARLAEINQETEGLIGAFKSTGERLAQAIEKCGAGNMDLPADLITKVQDLPGFDDTHKSYYYAHLVENPHVGRAFYNAPFEYKLNFIAKWISEKFPG